VSGPALMLGLVDQVVMTSDAFAYVSGPDTVSAFTGVPVGRTDLGGASVHDVRSGVTALVVDDDTDALAALATILDYLPDHHLDDPPAAPVDDPAPPACARAATAPPVRATPPYDARVIADDTANPHTSFQL